MTRYRKSWTQVLQEVREDCEDCKCDPCECATPGENYPEGHEPQGIDDQYMEESAALQLKMAFDDAKIKIKGTKGGKLVISKKDKKKVEKVIAKQMKKPEDAKRVLGSQIVFEDVLAETDYKYDGKVVKISKKDFSKVHKDFKNSTKGKERMLINDPKTGGSISVPVQFEEVELDEGYEKEVILSLRDKGIDSGFYKGKLYVAKRDVKKATEILKKDSDISKLPTIIGEEVELSEKGTAYPATVDTLRKIVKDKQHQTVMFDKGEALVDLFSASAMVQVYDALKPATKKKFEAMIKSKEGFMKSQAFAMKMAK